MSPKEAIERLRHRDAYVTSKIEELTAQGKYTYWLEKDRDAMQLAISALDYLEQVQEYEKAQQ